MDIEDLRDTLREKNIIPNWSHIGVPILMTATGLYFLLFIVLPTVIMIAPFVGTWSLILTPVFLVIAWLLSFFLMMK